MDLLERIPPASPTTVTDVPLDTPETNFPLGNVMANSLPPMPVTRAPPPPNQTRPTNTQASTEYPILTKLNCSNFKATFCSGDSIFRFKGLRFCLFRSFWQHCKSGYATIRTRKTSCLLRTLCHRSTSGCYFQGETYAQWNCTFCAH